MQATISTYRHASTITDTTKCDGCSHWCFLLNCIVGTAPRLVQPHEFKQNVAVAAKSESSVEGTPAAPSPVHVGARIKHVVTVPGAGIPPPLGVRSSLPHALLYVSEGVTRAAFTIYTRSLPAPW